MAASVKPLPWQWRMSGMRMWSFASAIHRSQQSLVKEIKAKDPQFTGCARSNVPMEKHVNGMVNQSQSLPPDRYTGQTAPSGYPSTGEETFNPA
jgi:hypothetical protein